MTSQDSETRPKESIWRYSIGRRFIVYIMLFSSVVTLASTSVQLYFEYRRDIGIIDQNLRQIEKSHLKSVSEGVWAFNKHMLQVQLQGILDLPDMRYVEISKDGKPFMSVGSRPAETSVVRDFPLDYEHRNSRLTLGNLQVVVGMDGVYARLKHRITVILLTQGVKTFVVSAFIFLLFHILVGRHLKTMAQYARTLGPDSLEKGLVIPRSSSVAGKDELGVVIAAVNTMRLNLLEDITRREAVEQELRIQAAMLEEEIAERQKAQEALHHAKEMAEAANRAKTLFLANMSHELRTPLNGVVGMAQLLAITGINEEQKEYLDTLQYSAGNLLALISDILDITKIESEQMHLCTAEFSLRECIEAAIDTQRNKIREKGLILLQEVPENLPDAITGDRTRVWQILTNLLSNAVKFTDRGEIRVTVSVKERLLSTLLLDISVADTGTGIAEELADYIFNAFTQADESHTRRHGGAGLGLAISRKLAELMGGSITLESHVGKGSIFHLLLPCTVPSCPSDAQAITKTTTPTFSRSLSILVAEDNHANALYIRKMLKMLGHEIVLANNGKEALKAWRNGAFDLILMDIQMPEMNGDEAVAVIRQQEGESHIPVIAVTAHAVLGDQEKFIQSGCDGYVPKPFRLENLVAEMQRVLQAGRQPDAGRTASAMN